MDTLWIWIANNSWSLWLPAGAAFLALIYFLSKRRKHDLRKNILPRKPPRWSYIVLAILLLLSLSLIVDPTVRRIIREFLLPTEYYYSQPDSPFLLQAFVFSLIGIPLILQGLAFGWLRRLFTSAVHCPKCRYDLASLIKLKGEASTTCPECGFTPSPDNPIGKPNKRKRLIVAGALLVLLGCGLSGYRYWNFKGTPVPAFFTRAYTNITGDLHFWKSDPFPLNSSLTLKFFNEIIRKYKDWRYDPGFASYFTKSFQFYQHSRALDFRFNEELALADPHQQASLFYTFRGLLNKSAKSPTRSSDVAASPIPLDAVITLFYTPAGEFRKDLDPATLLATYRDPQTPALTKAAIVGFAHQFDPRILGLRIIQSEPDPKTKRMLMDILQQNSGARLLNSIADPSIEDSLLVELMELMESFGLERTMYGHTPLQPAVEERLLTYLERPESILTRLPQSPNRSPSADRSFYVSRTTWVDQRLSITADARFKPRWQALLDQLIYKAQHVEQQYTTPQPAPTP